MANDATTRFYERFTPQERVALVVKAMARDDEAEVARLKDSCPVRTYEASDAAYTDRLVAAFDVLGVVLIDLRYLGGKVEALRAAARTVRDLGGLHHVTADMAFLEGVACATGRPQVPYFAPAGAALDAAAAAGDPAGTDLVPVAADAAERIAAVGRRAERSTALTARVLRRAARGVAQALIDTWTAYGRFCRERLAVEPEELLNAFVPPIGKEIRKTLGRYEGRLRPRPRRVGKYFEAVDAAWERRFG